MTRILLLLGIAIASVLPMHQEVSYSFVWQLKVGEESTFRQELSMRALGMNVKHSWLDKRTVVKANGDGTFDVRSEFTNYRFEVDGESFDGPEKPMSGVIRVKPTGEFVEYIERGDDEEGPTKEEDASSLRLGQISVLYPPKEPVQKGGEWTHEQPANEKLGLPAARFTYRFEEEEDVSKWKGIRLKVTYEETEGAKPMKGTGTVWVDRETFQPLKEEFEFLDVAVPAIEATADMTSKSERLE